MMALGRFTKSELFVAIASLKSEDFFHLVVEVYTGAAMKIVHRLY